MEATQLSLLSEDELTRLERKIREGLKQFVDVGNALKKIQTNYGYKLRGYKTFEAYCEKEFGFTGRHGRRYILAAETAGEVNKALGQLPANESVARQLQSIAKDPVILQKVKDKLEKKKTDITKAPAEVVAEAVAAVTGKTKSESSRPAPKANGNGSGLAAHKLAHQRVVDAREADASTTYIADRLHIIRGHLQAPSLNPGAIADALKAVNECLAFLKASDSASAKTKTCTNCGQALQDGVSLCFNCGEVIK